MDIDNPAPPVVVITPSHVILPTFSASFPLPFRVLALVGLAILLWAVNLHVLWLLGIDAEWALAVPPTNITNGHGHDELNETSSNRGAASRPVVLFENGDAGAGDEDPNDVELLPSTSGHRQRSGSDPHTLRESSSHLRTESNGSPRRASASSTSSASVTARIQGHTRAFSAPALRLGTLHASTPYSTSARATWRMTYLLFLAYASVVACGWLVFQHLTSGGSQQSIDRHRYLPALLACALVAISGAGVWYRAPAALRSFGLGERAALLASLKRIALPPRRGVILFRDVILADILTSLAKVLGDLVLSAHQTWVGGLSLGRVRPGGPVNIAILAMVCLPYALRLRQCLVEYFSPSNTYNLRPLANALKYATAFPVVILSAMQRNVIKELAEAKGITIEELDETSGRWFGEHRLFRLWLLAVVVNSLYSFWWDVTNDWGLSMLKSETWKGTDAGAFAKRLRRLLSRNAASPSSPAESYELGPHQRSPCPTPHPDDAHPSSSLTAFRRPLLFGLRPTLLLPDPLVYHVFIAIDFVLRVTWSLKLSSHLHTVAEIESGVFLMEALELVRRWMWVFLRIEWEAVKKLEQQRGAFEKEEV